MKKFIIVLCLGLLVVACKKEEPKAPGLLDKVTKAVDAKTDEVKAEAEKAKTEAKKIVTEAKKTK